MSWPLPNVVFDGRFFDEMRIVRWRFFKNPILERRVDKKHMVWIDTPEHLGRSFYLVHLHQHLSASTSTSERIYMIFRTCSFQLADVYVC